MSLILDALNKADRERDNNDKVPDLSTRHAGSGAVIYHQRWLLILAAVVLTLLVAVAGLTFAWLRSSDGAVQNQAALPAVPASRTTAMPAKQLPPPEAQRPLSARTETAIDPEVQALYQAEQGEVQIVEPVVRAAASELEQPQNSVDIALARELWQESQTKPLPQVAGAKVITPDPAVVPPEPEPEIATDAAFENTMAALGDMPFLHELPVNLQNSIPTLMYAQHAFAEGAVVINKKRFMVGDSIAAGLAVEQILADGIVLSFNGTSFKLEALSSWVNY